MCDANAVMRHFCESLYTRVNYEPINSLSSILIIFLGLYGLYTCKTITNAQAFSFLTLTGIGSMLYHYTLQLKFQVLDEFPMGLCAMTLVYRGLLICYPKRFKLISIYFATHATCMLGYSIFSATEYLFFFLFGTSVVASTIVLCILIVKSGIHYTVFRRYIYATLLMKFSLLMWLVYEIGCHQFPELQFIPIHALWHATSSYSSYLLIKITEEVELHLVLAQRHKDTMMKQETV